MAAPSRTSATTSSAGLVVVCCARDDAELLHTALGSLTDKGHTVEWLEGVDEDPKRLDEVIERLEGDGLYVLCRSPRMGRERIEAMREILLAQHVPFARTLTVAVGGRGALADRILAGLHRASGRGRASAAETRGKAGSPRTPTPSRSSSPRTRSTSLPPRPPSPRKRSTSPPPRPSPRQAPRTARETNATEDEEPTLVGARGEDSRSLPLAPPAAGALGRPRTPTGLPKPSHEEQDTAVSSAIAVKPADSDPQGSNVDPITIPLPSPLAAGLPSVSAIEEIPPELLTDDPSASMSGAAISMSDLDLSDLDEETSTAPRLDRLVVPPAPRITGNTVIGPAPSALITGNTVVDGAQPAMAQHPSELSGRWPLGQRPSAPGASSARRMPPPAVSGDTTARARMPPPPGPGDTTAPARVQSPPGPGDTTAPARVPPPPGPGDTTAPAQRAPSGVADVGPPAAAAPPLSSPAASPAPPVPGPAVAMPIPQSPRPSSMPVLSPGGLSGAAGTSDVSAPPSFAAPAGATASASTSAAASAGPGPRTLLWALGGGLALVAVIIIAVVAWPSADAPDEVAKADPAAEDAGEPPGPDSTPASEGDQSPNEASVPPPATAEYQVVTALRLRKIRALDVLQVATARSKPTQFDQANAYCDGLDIEGLTGWRLPEVGELSSMSRARMIGRGYYWSNTAGDSFGDRHLAWNVRRGYATPYGKNAVAVCVRGGAATP